MRLPIATVAYVLIIVLVNRFFGFAYPWPLVANVLVGVGFIVRDHAQCREVGDRVLWATAAGVAFSFLASPAGVAGPSAFAFAISETADWAVVRRLAAHSMRTRVLVSHLVSVPLDTVLFLSGVAFTGLQPWNWTVFGTMLALKNCAVAVVWFRR